MQSGYCLGHRGNRLCIRHTAPTIDRCDAPGRPVELSLGVAYGSAPRAVQSILFDVARRIAGISSDPAPVVLFMGFGESSLDFCVRAWTDSFDQAQAIRSELAIAIHDALQAAGIDIPFPQRDVYIRSIEPGIISPL